MPWFLELWVEGPSDASFLEGDDPAIVLGGALFPIVVRTLKELSGLSDREFEQTISVMKPKWLRHVMANHPTFSAFGGGRASYRLSGRAQKIMSAMTVHRRKFSDRLVVVAWDRDRDPSNARDRDQVHDEMRTNGYDGFTCAVCVEAVEAWLLADPTAFRERFGVGPKQGLPGKPERDPHPKETLNSVLGKYKETSGLSIPVLFRRLAEAVDLTTLDRKCQAGYGRFRSDAKRFLVPLING